MRRAENVQLPKCPSDINATDTHSIIRRKCQRSHQRIKIERRCKQRIFCKQSIVFIISFDRQSNFMLPRPLQTVHQDVTNSVITTVAKFLIRDKGCCTILPATIYFLPHRRSLHLRQVSTVLHHTHRRIPALSSPHSLRYRVSATADQWLPHPPLLLAPSSCAFTFGAVSGRVRIGSRCRSCERVLLIC